MTDHTEPCDQCGEPAIDVDARWAPVCENCLTEKAADLLRRLRNGDDDAVATLIASAPPSIVTVASPSAVLMREAADCARRGDHDEAMHRLRLAAEPKFNSLPECEAACAAAMGRPVPSDKGASA